jgi:uncharacterized protein YdbL (DUF1318 family)
MRIFLILLLALVVSLGCARVKVEAPEKPIKIDITMRIDVYQHVVKDLNSIEDMVSGSKQEPSPKPNQKGELNLFVTCAFAQEGLGPEVQAAVNNRIKRRSLLADRQAKGVIGENRMGLVEIRNPAAADATAQQLVRDENNDRMTIYKSVAEKNGAPLRGTQEANAARLQQDAPAGTPIEVVNEAGASEWRVK